MCRNIEGVVLTSVVLTRLDCSQQVTKVLVRIFLKDANLQHWQKVAYVLYKYMYRPFPLVLCADENMFINNITSSHNFLRKLLGHDHMV